MDSQSSAILLLIFLALQSLSAKSRTLHAMGSGEEALNFPRSLRWRSKFSNSTFGNSLQYPDSDKPIEQTPTALVTEPFGLTWTLNGANRFNIPGQIKIRNYSPQTSHGRGLSQLLSKLGGQLKQGKEGHMHGNTIRKLITLVSSNDQFPLAVDVSLAQPNCIAKPENRPLTALITKPPPVSAKMQDYNGQEQIGAESQDSVVTLLHAEGLSPEEIENIQANLFHPSRIGEGKGELRPEVTTTPLPSMTTTLRPQPAEIKVQKSLYPKLRTLHSIASTSNAKAAISSNGSKGKIHSSLPLRNLKGESAIHIVAPTPYPRIKESTTSPPVSNTDTIIHSLRAPSIINKSRIFSSNSKEGKTHPAWQEREPEASANAEDDPGGYRPPKKDRDEREDYDRVLDEDFETERDRNFGPVDQDGPYSDREEEAERNGEVRDRAPTYEEETERPVPPEYGSLYNPEEPRPEEDGEERTPDYDPRGFGVGYGPSPYRDMRLDPIYTRTIKQYDDEIVNKPRHPDNLDNKDERDKDEEEPKEPDDQDVNPRQEEEGRDGPQPGNQDEEDKPPPPKEEEESEDDTHQEEEPEEGPAKTRVALGNRQRKQEVQLPEEERPRRPVPNDQAGDLEDDIRGIETEYG